MREPPGATAGTGTAQNWLRVESWGLGVATLVHSSKRGKPEGWLLGRWGVAHAANREGQGSLVFR